jgi:hypothetical protein
MTVKPSIFRQHTLWEKGGCVAGVCCRLGNFRNTRQQARFERVLPPPVADEHTRQHTAPPLYRRGLPVALLIACGEEAGGRADPVAVLPQSTTTSTRPSGRADRARMAVVTEVCHGR